MTEKTIIHLPCEKKEAEKLLHEIALFRAETTLRVLRAQGTTPAQLQKALAEVMSEEKP